MRSISKMPCMMPSSPKRPCSALKATSGRRLASVSAILRSTSTRAILYPSASRAAAQASPERSDTSRSTDRPPISTATCFGISKIQFRLGFGGLALGLFKDGRVLPPQMQRVACAEKLLDGNDLNLWELPVVGLKEASGCGLRDHALARRFERQKHAHLGALLIHRDDEILHHRRIEALAAHHRDDDSFS